MKAVNITICDCSKYLDNKNWRKYKDIRDIIMKRVREQLPKAKISLKPIELPKELKIKKDIPLIAVYQGKEYKPHVMLKLAKCNLCVKEGTRYFEAILQIRGKKEMILEKAVEYLHERISGLKSRGVFINKIDRFKDGFDLFMTSNKATQMLGREMLDMFGGKIKVSPRLYTKHHLTSKEVYRVNVFLELPQFGKGDFIVHDNHVYLVEKVGKKIKLKELSKGRHLVSDYDKLDYTPLPKQKAYVAKTYPQLEVINPHDFQASMIKNKPETDFVVGQNISVVIYKGIYVVE